VMQQVDVQVNYPMPVPMAMPQPMMYQQVPVPYGQPYPVEVEKRVEVPSVQTRVIEKIVEVPVAVPVPQVMVQEQREMPMMQVQTSEFVHPPVTVGMGEPVEVSRRMMGTGMQMLQPTMMVQPPMTTMQMQMPMTGMSSSFVGPPATPPRSVQQANYAVMGMDRNRDGIPDALEMTAPMMPTMQMMQPPMTSYTGPPAVIGASQRIGAMTPPTPPVATRSIGSAPLYGGYGGGPPMPMVSGQMQMRPPMTEMRAASYAGGPVEMRAPMTGPVEMRAPMTGYGMQTFPSGMPTPPMPPRSMS